MYLQSLQINNFRNYESAAFSFSPQANLIYGANAQGKSNLVEAIAYLALASSYRGARDSELIRWEQPYFFLQAELCHDNGAKTRLTAAVDSKLQRRWTVNYEPVKRLSEAVGHLHTVIFTPEDLLLLKSGPEARRRYLNRQMSQLSREYCDLLISYNRLLRQRNAVLRQGEYADISQLEVWDEQISRQAAEITYRRGLMCRRINPMVKRLHASLSNNQEQLELFYHSRLLKTLQVDFVNHDFEQLPTADELYQAYKQEFVRLRRQEMYRGLTLLGPQRDDLLLMLNGRPAREFASQGQQRTAAIALKTAELELIRSIRGEYPLLILDDALSELDASRRGRLRQLMHTPAQTFLTDTNDAPFSTALNRGGRKFQINNGRLFRQGVL